MANNTVLIKGPMHPDMFDGETPMMIAVPVEEAGEVYTVAFDAVLLIEETFCYDVMATSREEAEAVAENLLGNEGEEFDSVELTTCRLCTPDELKRINVDELARNYLERVQNNNMEQAA